MESRPTGKLIPCLVMFDVQSLALRKHSIIENADEYPKAESHKEEKIRESDIIEYIHRLTLGLPITQRFPNISRAVSIWPDSYNSYSSGLLASGSFE